MFRLTKYCIVCLVKVPDQPVDQVVYRIKDGSVCPKLLTLDSEWGLILCFKTFVFVCLQTAKIQLHSHRKWVLWFILSTKFFYDLTFPCIDILYSYIYIRHLLDTNKPKNNNYSKGKYLYTKIYLHHTSSVFFLFFYRVGIKNKKQKYTRRESFLVGHGFLFK